MKHLVLLLFFYLVFEVDSLCTEAPQELVDPNPIFNSVPANCDPSIQGLRANFTAHFGVHSSLKLSYVILIFILVGFASAFIAWMFHFVRKVVYKDADNLDTTFDAGGKVSIGLTATTLVSQWTWSATLLQSCTVASKYGVSGPFWYAAGCTALFFLFSILSIQLKIRAPGAKTFLQVIKARFGKVTHIVFTVFAAVTNVIVLAILMVGGCAVLNSLVQGLNVELSIICFVAIIGGYTLIGGLGATFYVSYFNSALIYCFMVILIVKIYNSTDSDVLGTPEEMYKLLQCTQSPTGNLQRSYLTFKSIGGLYFGIINVVGCFGVIYLDQSNWQSCVAAKPLQGVWGYILGGLTWFAVPFCLATTMGLTYLSLSSAQGQPMLNTDEINQGLVAPVVAQVLLGNLGEYAILFMILMAVMSTGSAEVIAITSLIIYDIYQGYVYPYRENIQYGECILCGKSNIERIATGPMCQCISMKSCACCLKDTYERQHSKKLKKGHYTCSIHGDYRAYLDGLKDLKNWSIVWVTILIIPLFFLCYGAGLNLGWLYLFMGVLLSPCVLPVIFTLLWARVNSKGIIAGCVGGVISGLIAWLIVASTFPGGLTNFIENTGQDLTMMAGNSVSFVAGGFFTVFVTLVTSRTLTPEEEQLEWEKTRNIDNPLNPWTCMYEEELGIKQKARYYERPDYALVEKTFRRPKWTAYIIGILFFIIVLFVWPAIMTSLNIFSLTTFIAWSYVTKIWAYVAAAFIIIVPLSQEVYAIWSRIRLNQKDSQEKERSDSFVIYNKGL